MTKLSVNINKIAVIRNSRGGNNPDVIKTAIACEKFGAEGITVHPRPDERHIRYADVVALKKVVTTELNIEGNPDKRFMQLVRETVPHQVTLVPDAPDAITSNAGWDTVKHQVYLTDLVAEFKAMGIRTSIFLDPNPDLVEAAAKTGTNRIELYTESYAVNYHSNPQQAIKNYAETAKIAANAGLEINAGHDLDLNNLAYFYQNIEGLKEVSIGHALVCDALYLGLENTIQLYLRQLK